MAQLTSDVAVANANQVMTLVQLLKQLRQQLAELVTVNANNPLGNLWNTLNTTAVLSDGELGTADAAGTPNAAHPIDPRVYPALSRLVKSSDLTNALQVLVDLQTFLAGTATTANAARPAQINAVSM